MSILAWKLIGILVVVVLGIMLHHKLKHGYFWDIHDIDNHETIALFLIGVIIGIIIGCIL